MSMVSSACADCDNEQVKEYAKMLREAMATKDWEKVKKVERILESGPFSE